MDVKTLVTYIVAVLVGFCRDNTAWSKISQIVNKASHKI